MTATGREIRERHLVGAADFGVHMVPLAREPVRRKPFGHRIRVDERPIDLLGRRTQHAVKPDGVCRHYLLLSLGRSSSFNGDLGVMALLPNARLSARRGTVCGY